MRSTSMAIAIVVTMVFLQAVGLATQARADYKPFIRTNDGYGAYTKNKTSSGHTMNYGIEVRDFDGIPDGGTNYTVTVQNPSGGTQTLTFDKLEGWHTGQWSGGGDPVADGDYTFTVTDPDGHTFTIVDTLTSTTVPIISPVNITDNGTSPTISWTPVSGATNYKVRIFETSSGNAVWERRVNQPTHTVPPSVLAPGTDYYVLVQAFIGHRGFQFREVDDYSESADYAFTTGAVTEAPYFALDLEAFYGGLTDSHKGPHTFIQVHLFNAQGLDHIKKVYAVLPDGTTKIPLWFDYNLSAFEGVFQAAYPVLLTGTYSLVAEDLDGHVTTQTVTYSGDTVSPVDNSSLSPVHNTVLSGDLYNFTWDRVDDATFYLIELLHADGSFAESVLVADTGSNPTVSMPVDAFYRGALFKWRVMAFSDWGENDPLGRSVSEWTELANNFRSAYASGGSGAPVLDNAGRGAYLIHNNKWNMSGTEYFLDTVVKVTDPDGVPGNIKYVRVTYPGGGTQYLSFHYSDSAIEGYYYGRQAFPNAASVPSGTYAITVEDAEGNIGTINDDLTPVDLGVPQNCRPVNGAHVSDRPRFQCDEVTGASKYLFRVYENWNTFKAQSPYLDTFIGRSDTGELDKNALYRYRAFAFSGNPETDWDNLSVNMYFPTLEPYFLTDKPAGAGPWQLLLLND